MVDNNIFLPPPAVVMAEFVKLLASLFLVFKQEGSLQVSFGAVFCASSIDAWATT